MSPPTLTCAPLLSGAYRYHSFTRMLREQLAERYDAAEAIREAAGLTPAACRGDTMMMAGWAGPQQQRLHVSTKWPSVHPLPPAGGEMSWPTGPQHQRLQVSAEWPAAAR